MLENVFTELYEKGILIFLNVENYCVNNTDDVEVLEKFKKRKDFLECFDEPLERGYIFTLNTSINNLLKEIDEESCATISYGFESDTDEKADDVGRDFVEILNRHGYYIEWTEIVKDKKILTIVVSEEDIPNVRFSPNNSGMNLLQELSLNLDGNTVVQIVSDTEKGTKEVKGTNKCLKCLKCEKVYKQHKSFTKHIEKCKKNN